MEYINHAFLFPLELPASAMVHTATDEEADPELENAGSDPCGKPSSSRPRNSMSIHCILFPYITDVGPNI
jgi:hypothetical protein